MDAVDWSGKMVLFRVRAGNEGQGGQGWLHGVALGWDSAHRLCSQGSSPGSHFQALQHWASYITSLCCGFPSCKMGAKPPRDAVRIEWEHPSVPSLHHLDRTNSDAAGCPVPSRCPPTPPPGDTKLDGDIHLARISLGGWNCLKF